MSAIAHLIMVIISATIAAFCTAVLADGRSVIVLKTGTLPLVTNPAVVNASLTFLLQKTYGMGLHHDNAGRYWADVDEGFGNLNQIIASFGVAGTLSALPSAIAANALKNPVEFLQCKDLQTSCVTAMVLGFIGAGASVVMLLLHGAALGGLVPPKPAKMFALLMWTVYVVAFMVVVILGFNIYTNTWTCDNPVIPTLKLDDSFDLSYAIPFAIVGMVASFISLCLTAFVVKSADAGYSSKATGSSSASSTSSSSSS